MHSGIKKTELSLVTQSGYPSGLYRMKYESGYDGTSDNAMIRPPETGGDWVVVLHGFGGHENQLYMRKDIKQCWLPEYIRRGIGILTPNLRGNAWMNDAAMADMDALLEFLRNEYGARRFFFASGSLGATSNLIYGGLRPQNVSGVVACGAVSDLSEYYKWCERNSERDPFVAEICASIRMAYGAVPDECSAIYEEHSPIRHIDELKGIPICLVHGGNDNLMPISQSRNFAAAMGDANLFSYLEIADGSHDAPLSLQSLPNELSPLEWVLSKSQL